MTEQKRQERNAAMKKGGYSLTPELYNTLRKGDVIVFSEHGGNKNHTAILLCGKGIDIIEEQAAKIDIAQSAIETAMNHACPLCADYLNEAELALKG